MAQLSRRAFISATAGLGAAFAIPTDALAQALTSPPSKSRLPSTLEQTVKLSRTANKQFYPLVSAAGEPYVVRTDITGRPPQASRVQNRRSLGYLGHFSDIHIVDAQSPGRLEPLIAVSKSMIDASRPQDTMTVQVLAQMVSAMTEARYSPVTGAPMAIAINTGDSADSRSSLELDWCVTVMDGGTVTPNSGAMGQYQGVQIWPEADYVYHPYQPNLNEFGTRGFPELPNVLTAAVDQEVRSVGLPVPWYILNGNHDTLFMGNIPVEPIFESWAIGDRKASLWPAMTDMLVNWWGASFSMMSQFYENVRQQFARQSGIHTVTANSARVPFNQIEFMQRMLDSPATPGPVGHGFTQQNIDSGQTWWKTDAAPWLRVFGLNTCNQVIGADGAVPQDQYDWLESELQAAQRDNVLAIVASHHNSFTLENIAEPAIGPSQPLIHADQFIEMLQQYPNMIAWVNGHTHINTITPHAKQGGGGFWEITTASCVDYPQQQQTIEIVDNRDGTISIFTTALNHDSPATWTKNDYSQQGLASLSRTLAANAWQFEPLPRTGSEFDRNTELLLPSPFDLEKISDAEVSKQTMTNRARLTAYERKAVQ